MQALLLAMKGMLLWAGLLSGVTLSAACVQIPERPRTFTGTWLVDGSLGKTPVTPSHLTAQPPRVAVVLGGGGLRGYAHIGVLQALDDAGIHPDLVVGTSVGAIIGAAYASGSSADQLWEQASDVAVFSLADPTLDGPGFIEGKALSDWVNTLVRQLPIEDFPVPFAAVATDINLALPYVITGGNTGEAVRASAAIPGIFLPVSAAGQPLIDGGVTSLVPVFAARALGADVVIAVDVYCHGPRSFPRTATAMWLNVARLQSCLLAAPETASADVLIAPAVTPAGMNSRQDREPLRRLGYDAAVALLPSMRDRLAQKQSASLNGTPPGRTDAATRLTAAAMGPSPP